MMAHEDFLHYRGWQGLWDKVCVSDKLWVQSSLAQAQGSRCRCLVFGFGLRVEGAGYGVLEFR